MNPAFVLACWERAAADEIGLIITLDDEIDKKVAVNTLYKARQESGNPDLESLSLCQPGDNPKEIWLVKKTTDMTDIK